MTKSLLLITMAIVAFGGKPTESFAQTSTTVYTPRNTAVPALRFATEPYTPSELAGFTAYVTTNYPQATIIAPATGKYNCHSYGWHSNSTANNIWLNTPSDDKYWTDGSYTYVSSAVNAIKWSYAGDDHSARTYPTGQATTFRSKWGAWPLMYHNWNYTPYNSSTMWAFESCPASSSTCKAPGSFWYSGLTATTVTLNWTRACNAKQYQVQYRLSGTSTWTGLSIFNASTAAHFTVGRNITNLASNTCYNFRLKVINGTGVAYSSAVTVCTNAQRPEENEINPFEGEMNDYSEEAMEAMVVKSISEREASGLEESKNGKFFPNPATDYARLNYILEQNGTIHIELFDAFNRLVMEKSIASADAGEQTFELNLSNLPNGLYLARVSSGTQMETHKLEILK